MISFDALPGNAPLKNSLKNALSGRFPQTILISGDAGSGLAEWAKTIAAALLCESGAARPCGACVSCRKAEQDVHPDLTIVDEGENELKVDLARRIKAENAIVPNDGDRRVTVIHHAQNLNPAAQNALLKVLEEPPGYAFFILSTEQPDALLQTVRSRCVDFALEPPKSAISDEEASALLAPYLDALAAGREDGLMKAALALEKTPRRALLTLFGLLQAALRDAVLAANGVQTQPLMPALSKQAAALSRAVSSARLLEAYDFIDVLLDRVSRNAASAGVTCALTSDLFRICYL